MHARDLTVIWEILRVVGSAAVAAATALVVDKGKQARQKREDREQSATTLLRALLRLNAYFEGAFGIGTPVEAYAMQLQSDVVAAANAYADVSRRLSRGWLLRGKLDMAQVEMIRTSALGAANADLMNYEDGSCGPHCQAAIGGLVREHPDLRAEAKHDLGRDPTVPSPSPLGPGGELAIAEKSRD